MRMKFVSLLGALALAGLAKPAAATDRTLELGIPKTRASFGSGYDSRSKDFQPQVCVTFAEEFQGGEGGKADAHYAQILNNSELSDEMSIGVSTAFGVAMGVVSANVDTKVNFLKKTETNFFSQTILAVHKEFDTTKFIKGDIKLKDEYKALKGPQFKEKCGDYVVIGVQEGREFYGAVQFSTTDATSNTDFSTATNASGSYATYNASLGFDYAKKNSAKSKNLNLKVDIVSSGGNANATTIEELEREYKDFPTKGKKIPIKIIAVPYEEIVPDWPADNPLAPPTSDEKIDKLTEVAFALKALQVDLKFIKQNHKLFALGTSEKNRNAKVKTLDKSISGYESDLKGLRNDAQGCDVEFTSKCEALYAKWEKWDIAAKYEGLPQRYVSDCGQVAATIEFPSTEGELKLKPKAGGDQAFGDQMIKATAKFSIKKEDKKLIGTLDVTLAEQAGEEKTTGKGKKKKADAGRILAGVFTLGASEAVRGATKGLFKTAFIGSKSFPVWPGGVAGMPAGGTEPDRTKCRFDQPAYEGGGKGAAGSIDEMTGPHPSRIAKAEDGTGYPFTKGGHGLLKEMSCSWKTGGHADPKCKGFVFKPLKINLVNEQDVEADGGKGGVKKGEKSKKAKKKKTAVPGRNGKGKGKGKKGK